MPEIIKILAGVALAAVLSACASPSMKEEASAEFSSEGLHRVRSSGFDEAYVLPDANLNAYQSVDIEALESADVKITQTTVPGTTRRDWLMTPEREANLAKSWADATARAFSSYTRDSSSENVLRISAELTRVIPGRSSGTNTATGGQIVLASADTVDVEIELRLYDGGTNKLLAVIRDAHTIAIVQWTRGDGANLAGVFSSWAGLLHTRVSGK